MKKISLYLTTILVLIFGFGHPAFAKTGGSNSITSQGRKSIIGSHYGSDGFDTTYSSDKDLIFTFQNPIDMFDKVNSADLGARKGGGLGALYLSFPSDKSPNYNSAEVLIGEESFKYVTDGAANEGIYHLTLAYPLGTIKFIDRQDIASLGNGDFRFKIQKQTNDGLGESAKHVIGNRPIISFDMNVNNKQIDRVNGGIRIEIPYQTPVGEDTNQLAIYHIDKQGKLVQVKNSRYTEIKQVDGSKQPYVQGLINETGNYAIGYKKVSYRDVTGWYEPSANFVLTRGIMNDINGLFVPNNPITRGDLAFYLKNMSDQNIEPSNNILPDVPKDHPYAKSIDWACSTGVIKGYADGTFKPDQVITRQELAVMLQRYTQIIAKSHLPMINKQMSFKDNKKIGGFAKESVSYLQQANVIGGRGNGNFDPLDNVTRAECAKMITTIMNGIIDGKTRFIPIN